MSWQSSGVIFSLLGEREANKAQLSKIKANAYNNASNFYTNRIRAQQVLVAAGQNISAIKQDKILRNKNIIDNLAMAEADAKVSAAAAGVAGGSVQDTIYQAEANAGLVTDDAARFAKNEIQSQVNTTFGAMFDLTKKLQFADVPDMQMASFIRMGKAVAGAMTGSDPGPEGGVPRQITPNRSPAQQPARWTDSTLNNLWSVR